MKVLLAHNRYRLVGGEDRHVALLRQALDDAGVETRLFEPRSDGLTSSRARRLAAAALLTYHPGGGGIGRILEEWRPDVVHFHNTWPLLTPAALRLSKRAGAAVVLTAHNTRFACPGGTCTIETHPAVNGLADNRCLAGSSLRCALRHNPRGSLDESLAYGFAQDAQRRLHLLVALGRRDHRPERLRLRDARAGRGADGPRHADPARGPRAAARHPESLASPSTPAGSPRRRGSAR